MIGRLLAQQAVQSQYQQLDQNNGAAFVRSYDPNFRQVSRAPIAKAQNIGYSNSYPAGYEVASDASPDPVKPGAQYAQGGAALCALGPAACGVGMGLTAAQILGAAATAGAGALILNNKRKPPSLSDDPIDVPKDGIATDQSVYCKRMLDVCHEECRPEALGENGNGRYRICKRACLNNAGCYNY